MPTITNFYGIRIYMNNRDSEHNPPHIHVEYNGKTSSFNIQTLNLMYGNIPNRGEKMVKEWIRLYQKELLEMWNSGKISKLPPLD